MKDDLTVEELLQMRSEDLDLGVLLPNDEWRKAYVDLGRGLDSFDKERLKSIMRIAWLEGVRTCAMAMEKLTDGSDKNL